MKILYIMSSYNLYGGTPKKTLDLMKYFGEQSSIYMYDNAYPEFKDQFEATGGKVYEGFYGRNLIKHLRHLIRIIDQHKISIVQTQFTMGEILGYILKLFRHRIKFLITFAGALPPTFFKKIIVNKIYRKADAIVYISNYVKSERIKQFPILNQKNSEIIYNGTQKRVDNGPKVVEMMSFSLLDIAGLIELKNIQVVIKALDILINIQGRKNIFFYVAGDGPEKKELDNMINNFNLNDHVFLLGYQTNVGQLLDACDIFVHPAYAEGFGIAVAEAMMAGKPVIVANAGALPELIENEKTGLVVDPFDPAKWADAISKVIDNWDYADFLAHNAKLKAEREFSIKKYAENYEQLYHSL